MHGWLGKLKAEDCVVERLFGSRETAGQAEVYRRGGRVRAEY